MAKVVIPMKLLNRLYTEEKLSTWEIAKQLGCSQDTVVRRLHVYQIPVRTRRKQLPEAELAHLYQNVGLGVKQLAVRYQCFHTTVAARLHEMGLLMNKKSDFREPTPSVKRQIISLYNSGQSAGWIAQHLRMSRWTVLKTLRNSGIEIRHSNKRVYLNVKELAYLYEQRHMSTTELAALYDVKPATVAERLKEEGVRLRGNNLALDMFEVCRRYQEGHSPMQIADQLGCSYSAVRRRLDAWQGYKKRS